MRKPEGETKKTLCPKPGKWWVKWSRKFALQKERCNAGEKKRGELQKREITTLSQETDNREEGGEKVKPIPVDEVKAGENGTV